MAPRIAHTGTTNPGSPPMPAVARPTNTSPETDAANNAHTMICCGGNRRSSTTLNWVEPINAMAPAPKTSANVPWLKP